MNQHSLIGQVVDQFLVLSHIARGGMADVYLAEDQVLGRQVVLKLMLPELAANEELIARFQREAQTTAKLAHPHIVQIYSIGQAPSGVPYIALQYIAGGSLSDYLDGLTRKGEWIATTYALTICKQMASALTAAHNAGIIHRDLKPNNILMREDGTAVLSDLGIAAVQQATTRLTRTGGILGTPYYMSPEQAVGEKLDGRSDIYSLGVILYELLSKWPPFRADSPWAIVHQHVYEQPYPLEQVRPGLTAETYGVVKISLQKDPAARYQDAQQMVIALEEALQAESKNVTDDLTILDTLPSEMPRRQTPLTNGQQEKRSPWYLWLLLILLLLACGAAGFWGYNQYFAGEEDQPVVFEPGDADETNLLPTPIIEPEVVDPQIMETPIIPMEATYTPTAGIPTHTPTVMVPTVTPTAKPPTITPTSKPDFGEQVPLPGSSIVRMTNDNSASEFTPVLSPDQRTLLFSSDRTGNWQLYSTNVNGGDWNKLTFNDVDNYHPHYSPDGQTIVYASKVSGDWELYTMDTRGGNTQRLTYRDGPDEYPTFSPDGQWILYLSKRDNGWGAYVISRDGAIDRAIIDTSADETYPYFSPDGQLITYQSNARGSHDIFTMPWQGGGERQLTTNSARDANPVYSPDGQWIAFESDRSGNYEIYVIRPDGGDLRKVTDNPARDQIPGFSPDGRWLIFQSDRDGSWDIFRQPFYP